jgi:hypothetical protein
MQGKAKAIEGKKKGRQKQAKIKQDKLQHNKQQIGTQQEIRTQKQDKLIQ